MEISELKKIYTLVLKSYVVGAEEKWLVKAADLGHQMVSAGVPPEEIAEIHEEAIQHLGKDFPDKTLFEAAKSVSAPLMEMLMAYGLAFREREDKRKQAEDELQKSEQQLSLIYDSVSNALYYLAVEPDDCFRFLSVNQAFLEAAGLTEDQIIGKNYGFLFQINHKPSPLLD